MLKVLLRNCSVFKHTRGTVTTASVSPTERTKRLLQGVIDGERAKLAESITLVESKHPEKSKQAKWLLNSLLSRSKKTTRRHTVRLGMSGAPGSGKSTLIESFGKMLTANNYKVAVLAVDPSSSRTGGSILGDKTRMPRLTTDPLAYIRPSPSGGNLGGVARNTQEAILLCESAGYDVVIVETVGVGQSEIAVHNMVDMFILLVPPAAGDELQGLKKGIVEIADMIVITKSDGDLKNAAIRIQSEYLAAIKLIKASRNAKWRPRVTRVSSYENNGIDELWDIIQDYLDIMKESGQLESVRIQQQKAWLWAHVEWQLMQRFTSIMSGSIKEAEDKVMQGHVTPGTACDWLIEQFIDHHRLRT